MEVVGYLHRHVDLVPASPLDLSAHCFPQLFRYPLPTHLRSCLVALL
jgi:hypothetical protein